MECRVHRPWDQDTVRILFYEDGPQGRVAYVSGGNGMWERKEVPHGGIMPTSLELHPEFFDALMRAGSDFLPPSAASDNHLKDAVGVRDRLLAMVEKVVLDG